jgi:uncharacterized protein
MALTPQTALAAALVVLVVANVLNNRLAVPAYVVTSVVAASLLLALARLAGLSWAGVGLGFEALGRGALWGLLLGGLVAVGYLIGALVPVTRAGFGWDRRVEPASAGTAVYQVLLRIPFGTVLLEEVAFRGVVYGLVLQTSGTVWAIAVSSALFGLWHVLPTAELVRLHRGAGGLFKARGAVVVLAAVVASALVGAVLCELRRRSGSLVPGMAVHWATNALGYLTAFLVMRRRGR